MEKTLAETIKEITKKHLEENNGILLGQSITAVGWVNNTVPNCKNIIELPNTDVAGSGIAAGLALIGRRPIFVVRFQDFMMLNSSFLTDYAAKAKEIFGYGIPVFIRALAMEGKGTGPTHSATLHSIFMHMPGFKVCSPMTPKEYRKIWDDYMRNDNPVYVSEHRFSFQNKEDIKDIIKEDAEITLYGISAARFNIKEALKILEEQGIKCNFINILWLKPFKLTKRILEPIKKTKIGLIVDSDFENCGASEHIAYEIMKRTDTKVYALGARDKSVGTAERYENGTPSVEKIVERVKRLVKSYDY